MSDEEFCEWWAYYKLEPWDLSRVEEIAAQAVMCHMRGEAKEKQLYPFMHHDFEHERDEHAEELEVKQREQFEAIKKANDKMAEIRAKVEAEKAAKQTGKGAT